MEVESALKGFDDFDLRLGDVMRGERATLGKSLLDVQRDLKIKAAYIAAIENSDPSAFESPGFIAGYVRSYARYLGLDPEWAYSRFCRESDFATPDGLSKTRPASKDKRTVQAKAGPREPLQARHAIHLPRADSIWSRLEPTAVGSILVMAMLVTALGYGGWSVFREVQKVQFVPLDQAPGITSDIDVLASAGPEDTDTMLDETPVTPPSADALTRLYRPGALDVPVLQARDAPIASLNPDEVGTFAPLGTGPNVAQLVEGLPGMTADQALAMADDPAADAEAELAFEPEIKVVADAAPEVVLFAVRPSWVRVRAADGTVLFEKILEAGERYILPATEDAPILRAGNAGSVYFAVNGQTFGPAGTGPNVVKNLSLGAEALMAAYQPADPEADADLARFTAVAQAEAE